MYLFPLLERHYHWMAYPRSTDVALNGGSIETTEDDRTAEERRPKLRTILDISWEAHFEHSNDRARYKSDFRE